MCFGLKIFNEANVCTREGREGYRLTRPLVCEDAGLFTVYASVNSSCAQYAPPPGLTPGH